MGSLVAQRLAIDHPHRVAGLVLIGAFATLRGNAAVQELWDGSVAGLSDPVDPAFVRAFQESTLAQPVPPDFLDLVVRESLKLPAGIWRAALEGQMAEDTTPDLWRIAAPTLILWGDRDTIALHRDQRLLAAAIPGARLRVVPGAGHGLHWELPDLAAAEIAAFAESVAARADRARAPLRPAEDPGALLR
jgi:pimeloyl-ACP methyl ester carboxylesterase